MEKSEQFGLVMTPQEKAALVEMAARDRISAASVIRRLVWSEAKARNIVLDKPEADLVGRSFESLGGELPVDPHTGWNVNVARISGLRAAVQQQQRQYVQLREALCETIEAMPMVYPECLPEKVSAITIGALWTEQGKLHNLQKALTLLREMCPEEPVGQRDVGGDAEP